MMKVLLLFFTFLITQNFYTQSSWSWQNPLPQGNSIFNIQFVNSTTAYATASSGTLMKTTDSGETWQTNSYAGGSEKIMEGLYFLDENEGWAGGYDGKLLHTTDGGVSWDSVTGHSVQIITGIAFPNPLHGIIVTSYQYSLCCASVYVTTDGGNSWSNSPLPSDGQDNINDVAFANDTLGIAVGLFGELLRTTDGGFTWIKQDAATTENLSSVDHIGNDLWMAAGNGRIIIKSTDGGVTWSESFHGLTNSFSGLYMVDDNTAYVCGYGGEIQKTSDGGSTWTLQQSSTQNNLFAISFSDANTGIAAGFFGTIVRTTDGGSTWQDVSEGTVEDLRGIDFADAQTGFTCGAEGTILKTTNMGENWFPLSGGTSVDLYGISFVNNTVGTMVGDFGVVRRTSDGGVNWIPQASGIASPGKLNDVDFINENTGFAVGYNASSEAAIIKTTDGGSNWLMSPPGITSLLYSVDFINLNHGIVVGGNGTIIYTTDSGNSWQDRSFGFGYTLSSVKMVNNSFAVAAGYNYNNFPATGVIFISTDGGDTWTERSIGITETLTSARFLNENEGVACGSYGQVFRTSDGGMNWTRDLSGTDNSLYGLALTNTGKAFIAGRGGTLLVSSWVIPVSLSEFTADKINNKVILKWSTASEANNKGFEIQRLFHSNSSNEWKSIGFIEGFGTTEKIHFYSFEDDNVNQGSYSYRLKQVDFNGSTEYSKVIQVSISGPLEFSLNQNYPNPFNPSTIIKFSIPKESMFTTLKVFNSLGEEVRTLIKKELPAGNHEIHFNADKLSSGVYFYVLTADKFIASRKMIIMR